MANEFFTIFTSIGRARLGNATVTNTPLKLSKMAVGDGNGAYYNPTEAQTALKKELWRGELNHLAVDADNPNWIVAELVIPDEVGGFYIREVGLFDDAGNLIAIGKFPESYKPTLAAGSNKQLYIRMILEVSNASSVTLLVDPSVVMATRKFVKDEVVKHEAAENPHSQYVRIGSSRCTVFTENGEFVVPAGITEIIVSGCGAGGGGSSAIGHSASCIFSGGGGGAGQSIIKHSLAVSPGQKIPITIGAGGVGGIGAAVNAPGNPGQAGGNTRIGDLVLLGGGGTPAPNTNGPGGSGSGYPAGGTGSGGTAPSVTGTLYMLWPSGAGASSPFGGGGPSISGSYASTAGISGSGHGSGGSGSSCPSGATANPSRAGGNGAPGIVIIEW